MAGRQKPRAPVTVMGKHKQPVENLSFVDWIKLVLYLLWLAFIKHEKDKRR